MTTVAARAGERKPGEILWRPQADVLTSSAIGRYLTWVEQTRGLSFGADYHALWRWSVGDLAGFWGSLADYLGVRFHDQPGRGAHQRGDARYRVVPGRHTQLRGARAGRAARGHRPGVPLGEPPADRADPRRIA